MTAYLNIISRSRRQRRGGSPSVDGTAPRLQQQSISQVSQTRSHIKRYYLRILNRASHGKDGLSTQRSSRWLD